MDYTCKQKGDTSGMAYLMRQKQVQGFQTGDRVRAFVPTGKKAGTHTGRGGRATWFRADKKQGAPGMQAAVNPTTLAALPNTEGR